MKLHCILLLLLATSLHAQQDQPQATECTKITSSDTDECPEWIGKYMVDPSNLDRAVKENMKFAAMSCADGIRYTREMACSGVVAISFAEGGDCTERPYSVCKSLCKEFWTSLKKCNSELQEDIDQVCENYPEEDCLAPVANVAGPVVGAVVAATIAGVSAASASGASGGSAGASGASGGTAALSAGALWALVGQAQLIAIIGQFDVIFPTLYKDFTDAFSWTNLVLDFTSSIEGDIQSASRARAVFVNNVLTISLVLTILAGVYVLFLLYILFKFHTKPEEVVAWKKVLNVTVTDALIRIALLAYFQLSISSAIAIVETKWILFIAIIILIFYHLGFPLMVYGYLRMRFPTLQNVQEKKRKKFIAQYGSLFTSYKDDCYWFTTVSLLKNLLAGLAIGFAENEFYAQVVISIVAFLGYEIFVIKKRPFLEKAMNIIEIAVTANQIVVFILLIILKAQFSEIIAWVLLAVQVAGIVCNVIYIIVVIRKALKDRKEKKNIPEDQQDETLLSKLKALWKGELPKETVSQKLKRLSRRDITPDQLKQLAEEDKSEQKENKQDDSQKEDKKDNSTSQTGSVVIHNIEEEPKDNKPKEDPQTPEIDMKTV